MIKKPVFENELIAGMQHELRKMASGDPPDLVKAGECLHAALEILEDEGLQAHADKVLGLMEKIGASKATEVKMLPNFTDLGLSTQDLRDFAEGKHHARVKMNSVLRRSGMTDDDIKKFIGPHNFVSQDEITRYIKLLDMIKNPTKSDEPSQLQPGDPQQFTMKTLANKPGRPDKISDTHTKGLTPEKMVNNLKHHGTEFNMPDLGWSDNLDPEIAEAFDANNIDELEMADILDADITEDILEVSENETLEDFEDEVSLPTK